MLHYIYKVLTCLIPGDTFVMLESLIDFTLTLLDRDNR